jgi:uncharacterized coiled-coil protein SlyX
MQRQILTIEEQAIDRLNLQIVKLQQENDRLRSELQGCIQVIATHANQMTDLANNLTMMMVKK